MTAEEAYLKGQRDMRHRIERQWRHWRTGGLGGLAKAGFQHGRHYGNVSVLIRRENPVQPLAAAISGEKTNGR